uniref:Uncharacterized protein n=1 Tax=Candidatus Kentrum sp. DK TaxID=2126562 RepID=A0A450SSC2_9GAMM|nr:MAG: hypothetical protein BECKDK2373B_GA0170837_106115 [Candidatus Kentron sp. DK]
MHGNIRCYGQEMREICRQVCLRGEPLRIVLDNGEVVVLAPDKDTGLRPMHTAANHEKPSLFSMIGANRGSGLYQSVDEIDQYISSLREEWD